METKTVIGKEAGATHVRWMVGLYRSDNVHALSVFGHDNGVVPVCVLIHQGHRTSLSDADIL